VRETIHNNESSTIIRVSGNVIE